MPHAIRLASYKVIDDYAMERGFSEANISEAVVCIYDPLTEDRAIASTSTTTWRAALDADEAT